MRKGFTLIELIVVIAIIAVLAAIIAPNALKAIDKAKVSAVIGDYRSIKTAALSYYADTAAWPSSSLTDGGFLTDVDTIGVKWDGPYVESWPKDTLGTFRWCSNTGAANVTPCDSAWASGVTARYVEVNDVANSSAVRIDSSLDDGSNVAGNVRYANGTTMDVHFLISND